MTGTSAVESQGSNVEAGMRRRCRDVSQAPSRAAAGAALVDCAAKAVGRVGRRTSASCLPLFHVSSPLRFFDFFRAITDHERV